MMLKITTLGFWLLLITEMCFASSLVNKDVGVPAVINVEVGKVSEVVFPTAVTKVVKGGEPNSILVEVFNSSVYLLPKSEKPADIFVTTSDGQSYPLTFHLAEERDIKVNVGNMSHSSLSSSSQTYNNIMDLMKDLLLQKSPHMATVLPQEGKVFLSNSEIELTIEKAYQLNGWNAYILQARNLSDNAVIIPIEQITFPNLLAISCDQDMLFAKGEEGSQTKVYMIAEQT